MRILTHSAHSGFEYELAKTGHEFLAVEGVWDGYRRPKPANWRLVGRDPEGPFDVGLILAGDGYEKLRRFPVPIVHCMLGDNGEGRMPACVEDRVHSFVFLGSEVADRWEFRDSSKRRIIELGVDGDLFNGYSGDGGDVLTVGWAIPKRWEKGFMQLEAIGAEMSVTVIGEGNEGLRSAVGTMPFDGLLDAYRRHKVYLNPGPVIGMSVVEAMMVGMPVVAFRPINLRNLIMHGENGFVVDTVHGALDRMRDLLGDADLRLRVGGAARATALARFGIRRFLDGWNAVFAEAAASAVPDLR